MLYHEIFTLFLVFIYLFCSKLIFSLCDVLHYIYIFVTFTYFSFTIIFQFFSGSKFSNYILFISSNFMFKKHLLHLFFLSAFLRQIHCFCKSITSNFLFNKKLSGEPPRLFCPRSRVLTLIGFSIGNASKVHSSPVHVRMRNVHTT